jgi:hypothetical protein
MIDQNQMVERFLDEAVRQCKVDRPDDENAIRALNDRNESAEVRRGAVVKWLRSYSVLRSLTEDDVSNAVSGILEFADARDPSISPTSELAIIEKFNDLHNRCISSRVRPKKDGTPRSLPSLTSKTLWCCYPDAIRIFDSYAQRALWVVSRLMNSDRPAGTDDDRPYDRFLSVWLNLYHGVTIDDDRLGGYPYKIKVFDRILWIIGERDYGEKRRQPASS